MYCSQGYVQQIPQVRYNLASNLFFAQSDFEFLFHEESQYIGVWKYCGVYKILRCLFKNRLYTKLLRILVQYIHSYNTTGSRCAHAIMPLN